MKLLASHMTTEARLDKLNEMRHISFAIASGDPSPVPRGKLRHMGDLIRLRS